MDNNKVINLGHSAKQPLIQCSSELSDGLEPHGHILQPGHHDVAGEVLPGQRWGVPGVVRWWGTWEGAIPGTTQPVWI